MSDRVAILAEVLDSLDSWVDGPAQLPMGHPLTREFDDGDADRWHKLVRRADREDALTWRLVVGEAYYNAKAARSPGCIRSELVDLAARCVACIEGLDTFGAGETHGHQE